ncbi:MAG: cobalamin-dependent protein [Deltaproteobacteria bacterium]|nr:cobalamin-dependent protein [Deltaproteobacteria bacterium]
MASKKTRIIIGKLGLDSHDNGLRIISRWLMDSGYEVVYAGLYNTTKRIVQMALQEDADAIGISFLGGEHLYYAEDLLKELKKRDMGDKKVVIGGVMPPGDVNRLKSLGVDAVFTPGTRRDIILENIDSLFV